MKKLLSLLSPLPAAYAPNAEPPPGLKEEINKGVAALRALPKDLRQDCFAEKLGLLYMPNGDPAYGGKMVLNSKEQTKYYPVRSTARFIAENGKSYDFYETLGKIKQFGDTSNKYNKKNPRSQNWTKAKQAIYLAGEEAVFAAFSEEITKLCLQTAKQRLLHMSPTMREAFLAENSGLLCPTEGMPTAKKEQAGSTAPTTTSDSTDRLPEPNSQTATAMSMILTA